MARLALLILWICLWSGAPAAAAPAGPTGQAGPPLTASFETRTRKRDGHSRDTRERWTLTREPARITYSFGPAAERRVELWLRTAKALRLVRVFPAAQTAVEYTEGQLRALGNAHSWQQLSSLLPAHPRALGLKRKPAGQGRFLQHETQRFEGELGGAHVSVQWLEAQQLPARLSVVTPRLERTVTLHKLVVGSAQLASDAEPKRYRRIDAADLGDLEHDPFVQRYGALLHAPHEHAQLP